MTHEAFIQCNPPTTTAQQHKRIFKSKTGKMFLGTDQKGNAVMSELCALLMTGKPKQPFPQESPLKVEIALYFPYRKSERKGVVRLGLPVPHKARPDVDNLAKFILDSMTRCGFWSDDGQIYDLTIRKFYSAETGIRISITDEFGL